MLRARKLDFEEALLRLHNCFFEARRLEVAVDVQEELVSRFAGCVTATLHKL
jgi:hypothetical protein